MACLRRSISYVGCAVFLPGFAFEVVFEVVLEDVDKVINDFVVVVRGRVGC